jgi:hypothetical protein
MKLEKDEFKLMILDGFQVALKVSANSIYGFLTAHTLQCQPIGASVTAIGRQMIKQTKDYVNNNYSDFRTIYGDSVTGDTPVIVKNREGIVDVMYIKDIGNEWEDYSGESSNKEQTKSDYQVWTGIGWSGILRVIRHNTTKKIFRIKTNKGMVCVTEDHSLFNDLKEKIKPGKCEIGKTKLWHNKLEN